MNKIYQWPLFASVLLAVTNVGAFAQSVPTNVKVKPLSSSSIVIAWSGTADNFVVARSVNGSGFSDIATVAGSATSYTDTGLSASSPYLYKIRSVQSGVKSNYTAATGAATKALPPLPAITSDISGKLSVQKENSNSLENSSKAIDGNPDTKYLFAANSGWLVYSLPKGAAVKQYAIFAASDAVERDPKSWTLEGSNDNSSWSILDTKTNQRFATRSAKLHFAIANEAIYKYYRLNITENNGAPLTQLAEFKLFADVSVTRNSAAPAAPLHLSFLSENSANGKVQIMPSSNQMILNWVDNSSNEDYFQVERSSDQTNWDWSAKIDKNNTRYRSVELSPLTKYYYRVKAVNDAGESNYSNIVSATTLSDLPPNIIEEDWDVHRATLYLQYYDDEVAIYYDKDVDPNITWPRRIFGGIWKYLKQVYGNYSDPRLYVYFHAGKYGGGHPSTWSRADHHYRNILDLGTSETTAFAWKNFGGNNLDLPVHEIGHIMEGASLYVHGSPQRVIWGDSKFAEIFNYDVYTNNNLSDQAQRWHDMQMANSDSSTPRAGVYWYRDFYYPIYSEYGGSKVLADFFVQMKKYMPQKDGDYTNEMNWGEFIHFYSIAAGVNLKQQATLAFGWSDAWEAEFVKAQADFPAEYSIPAFDIVEKSAYEVNFENASSFENSSRLFDQNYTTNYVADRTGNTTTPFTITVKGAEPFVLTEYSLVSADNQNQTSQYDPAEWNLYGSNTLTDWTLIDSKTKQTFSARKQKKKIALNSQAVFLNYKLEINKLNNSTAKTLYLAELELKGLAGDITSGLETEKADSHNISQLLKLADGKQSSNLRLVGIDGRTVYNGKASSEVWSRLILEQALSRGVYLYSLNLSSTDKAFSGKIFVH